MRRSWQGGVRTGLMGGAISAPLFFGAPKNASPAARLVVHGPHRGSTVRLKVRRGHLVVKGLWTRREEGCHFPRHHKIAVRPLGGVSSIALNMGPQGDRVLVEDRLPVSLTVSLGPGA